MKNLPRSLSKHEISNIHIQSQISFKAFGTSRIDLALNEQQRQDNSLRNSKVKENREILKILINGTCYLGNQELAFRGNDESATSFNHGNHVELIVFTLLLKTIKEFLVIWRLPQCFPICPIEYRKIQLKQWQRLFELILEKIYVVGRFDNRELND